MAEDATYRNALPLDSRLHQYRLETVPGAGGFGLTYRGADNSIEQPVAGKEYLGREFAIRTLDGSVMPVNTGHQRNYSAGLARFPRAIDRGLTTDEKLRPPNVTEWRKHFSERMRMLAPCRLDFAAFSAMMRAGSPLTTRVAGTAVPDSAKWLWSKY